MGAVGFRRTTAARRGELEQAHQARDAAEGAFEKAIDEQLAGEMLDHCANIQRAVDALTALAQLISIPGEMNRPLNYVGPLDARALRILDAIGIQGNGLITPILALRRDGSHAGAALAARRREVLG